MDTPLPLRAVLEAVANAIAEARARLDAAGRADLERFFGEDGRPRTIAVRPDPDGERVVDVPLLAITPPTVLQITEASVEFDVDPADLARFLESGSDTTAAGIRVVADGRGPARASLRFEPLPDQGDSGPTPSEPNAASDGLPLADLLSRPLMAADEARVGIAKASLDFLLEHLLEPTAEGQPLQLRTVPFTFETIVPGSEAGPDGSHPRSPVTHHFPRLSLVEIPSVGVKEVSVAFAFEVTSVSHPDGVGGSAILSGVAHPMDAASPPGAAPRLHIALKAEETGASPRTSPKRSGYSRTP